MATRNAINAALPSLKEAAAVEMIAEVSAEEEGEEEAPLEAAVAVVGGEAVLGVTEIEGIVVEDRLAQVEEIEIEEVIAEAALVIGKGIMGAMIEIVASEEVTEDLAIEAADSGKAAEEEEEEP